MDVLSRYQCIQKTIILYEFICVKTKRIVLCKRDFTQNLRKKSLDYDKKKKKNNHLVYTLCSHVDKFPSSGTFHRTIIILNHIEFNFRYRETRIPYGVIAFEIFTRAEIRRLFVLIF